MINKKLLTYLAVASLCFSACKKEGDIINNYGSSSDDVKNPPRTMLKGYGGDDTTQTLHFSYFNNQVGKLSELNVSGARLVIQYSGNNPSAFQVYQIPANTLSSQGTYKVDAQGRVIESILRQVNGDTTSIMYLQYEGNNDYQPSSVSMYSKADDRITRYEYLTYDKNGNLTRSVTYRNNGTKTYKYSETEASGYGKAINNLNQIYYYLLLEGAFFNGATPLFLSNYVPGSIRTQSYNTDGTLGDLSINDYELLTDNNNNVKTIKTRGSSYITNFYY
jgi:hypothetical protein